MTVKTIYEFAQKEMGEIVIALLELSQSTSNFMRPAQTNWENQADAEMLLCGKGYHIDDIPTLPSLDNAWVARLAVPFSIELAATGILYKRIWAFTDQLISDSYGATKDFREVNSSWIYQNPQFLPVFMHVAGAFSKQELKKQIGSATDKSISKPAAAKIAALLERSSAGGVPDSSRVKERIKATVEGIVRDLVGRLLLEQFVSSALARHGVPFKREEEYRNLEGVVYDFRSDFVVPDENKPQAFLEVRKSSSRHASLYAKDKMFSAINWKGKHPECLAVLIIDGPWTEVTLKIMASVFDYVIPISRVDEVALKIRAYLDGDKSVLQWLINFNIRRFRADGNHEPAQKVQIRPEELQDEDADA